MSGELPRSGRRPRLSGKLTRRRSRLARAGGGSAVLLTTEQVIVDGIQTLSYGETKIIWHDLRPTFATANSSITPNIELVAPGISSISVSDPATSEVIRGHLDGYAVANQNADAMFAHLA